SWRFRSGLPAAAGLLFVLLLVFLGALVVLLGALVALLGLVAASGFVRREGGHGGEESNREDRCQDGLHGISPLIRWGHVVDDAVVLREAPGDDLVGICDRRCRQCGLQCGRRRRRARAERHGRRLAR